MATPEAIDLLPDGVHLQWDDGHHGYYPYRYLRGECPCAACIHEMTGRRMVSVDDIPEDVAALDWMTVGRYAYQFMWSDGHDTGIYTYASLRGLCQCGQCLGEKGA